jgi:flagellar protein FlgJ
MAPLDPVPDARSPAATPDPELARFRRAAQDFEAIFLHTLLRTMRESVSQEGIFPRGNALKIYESLQDQEVARAMARGGGMGLSDLLVRDFTRRTAADKKASSRGSGEPIISAQPPAPAASNGAVISEEGLK